MTPESLRFIEHRLWASAVSHGLTLIRTESSGASEHDKVCIEVARAATHQAGPSPRYVVKHGDYVEAYRGEDRLMQVRPLRPSAEGYFRATTRTVLEDALGDGMISDAVVGRFMASSLLARLNGDGLDAEEIREWAAKGGV